MSPDEVYELNIVQLMMFGNKCEIICLLKTLNALVSVSVFNKVCILGGLASFPAMK